MPTPVRIHGYPVSTWTRTARMTCVEKGIEYELVPLALRTPEHAELHPFMRMPVLEVDGQVIAESLAITGYLDEAFAGPSLQPDSLAQRTRMRFWMGLCADYVFRDVVRTIPRERPPTAEELATARTVLERLDGLIDGSAFLAGGFGSCGPARALQRLRSAAQPTPPKCPPHDSRAGITAAVSRT
jgi:glutathione S-transferase